MGLPDVGGPLVTSEKGLSNEEIGPFVLRSGDPCVTDFVSEVTHQGRDLTVQLIVSDGTARAPVPPVPQQIAPLNNKKTRVSVFAP